MHVFTDSQGRSYELALTVAVVDRIRSLVKFDDGTPVDLCQIRDDQFLSGDPDATLNRVLHNPITFCQVLHAALNVPFAEFAQAMDGDGLDRAAEAFLAELIDFFPARRRPTLRALVAHQTDLAEAIEQKIRQAQAELADQSRAIWESPEAMESFIREQTNALARRFGVMPGNSASIPDRSRSGSSSTWHPPDLPGSGITPPPCSP